MTGTDILSPDATYTAAQVARLLFHTSLRSFNRHYRRRQREGFPAPVSRYGRKLWSGAALIAWRDRTADAARPQGVVDFGAMLDARARKTA